MNLHFLFGIINFLAFAAILVYFLRKPASTAMTKRNEKITEDIQLSKEMRHLAENEVQHSQKKLDCLPGDKKNIRNENEQVFQTIKSSEEKNLETELERIKKEAKRRAESEALLVKARLEKEIEKLVLNSTLAKLEKGMTQEVHEKLNREYLHTIENAEGLR